MSKLSDLEYGKDYTNKLEKFRSKMETIKNSYTGEYDTDSPMFIMQPNKDSGKVRIDVDKDVPEDLRDSILEAFDSVWK